MNRRWLSLGGVLTGVGMVGVGLHLLGVTPGVGAPVTVGMRTFVDPVSAALQLLGFGPGSVCLLLATNHVERYRRLKPALVRGISYPLGICGVLVGVELTTKTGSLMGVYGAVGAFLLLGVPYTLIHYYVPPEDDTETVPTKG